MTSNYRDNQGRGANPAYAVAQKEGRLSATFFPDLLNHLWQSTIFAGVAALVTLLMRQNSAAVRYRIWFAASLKFLIPFSLFVSIGGQLHWLSPISRQAPQIALAADETLMDIRESANRDRQDRGAPPARGKVTEPQPEGR